MATLSPPASGALSQQEWAAVPSLSAFFRLVLGSIAGFSLLFVIGIVIAGAAGHQIPSAELAFLSARGKYWEIHTIDVERGLEERLPIQGVFSYFAWSPDGSRITVASLNSTGNYDLAVIDMNTGQVRWLDVSLYPEALSWSPDGQHIAFSSRMEGSTQLYRMDADGSHPQRLTSDFLLEYMPAWSPDGQHIAFKSALVSGDNVFVLNADGTHPQGTTLASNTSAVIWLQDGRRLVFIGTDFGVYVADWNGTNIHPVTDHQSSYGKIALSPDGSELAFQSYHGGGFWDLYVVGIDGRNPRWLTNNALPETLPDWSPDGRMIAFTQSINTNGEIYIIDTDGTNLRRLTFHPGIDTAPAWRPLMP